MTVPSLILEKITGVLSAEKAQIEKALKNLKRDDPFSDPGRVNDNADSGTDAYEESEHLRIEAQEEALKTQLSAINTVEKMIADGTYGICISCGKPIDTDRLAAMPTALVCISCEKKNKS
jgi:DnaK suppressor protein